MSAKHKNSMVNIANPIYDVVFKYMMEDNHVAKILVSSIIGMQVEELTPKPQEGTTEKKKSKKMIAEETPSLTVYRLDFSAKIKTPDGYKLIIIELQKASLPDDIMRFRLYLGKQYGDSSNCVVGDDKKSEALPIYAIYFLGRDLGICDTPVLTVNPLVTDDATQEIVHKKSTFIEGITHKCKIVQINCLKKRRRNDVERLLSVFDQENRTSDIHILNVREEDFPEKHRPLIRRLKMAASNPEVKRQMEEEDSYIRYIQDIERGSHHKGLEEGIEKGRKEMKVVMDKALKEKNKTLKEKDKTIKEKDKTIEEKDKAIEEKDKAIAAALARIAELERTKHTKQ